MQAGEVLGTDWGDVGEVVAALDTGQSMIFVLWRPDLPAVRVHSSHAWRAVGPRHDARSVGQVAAPDRDPGSAICSTPVGCLLADR